MTLSIIVPTYNMEAYLAQCLDSLMPVVQEGDVEVLVVNDGSKDKSLEIAETYRLRQPECVKIVDKENGGYGSAVNAGLRCATGRYVKVLDADDWMSTATLRNVVHTLSKMDDVDVVIAPFNECYECGKIKTRNVDLPTGKVLDLSTNWRNKTILRLGHHYFMYSRRLLTSIGYSQLEHCLYTDAQWSFSPLASAKSVYAFAEPLYEYRLGREGQSVDMAVKKRKFADELRVAEAMAQDFARASFVTDVNRKYLETKLIAHLWYVYKGTIVLGYRDSWADTERLDETVKSCAPNVWSALGRKTISPFLAVPFVSRWRRNHEDWLLRMGRRLHLLFHKG